METRPTDFCAAFYLFRRRERTARPALSRSRFPKNDLIPAVHSLDPVTFLPEAHRFACDHAVDDFFVSRAGPLPHPAAAPINHTPGVIISFGAFREIEKRARISSENRDDVLECCRIAQALNLLAKWRHDFCRDCAEAEHPAIAQFPKWCVDVRREWIHA